MEQTEMVNEQPTEMDGTATQQADTSAMDADALRAELERARKALHERNAEAAKQRKKLETYEQTEAARKQAEMTEAERLKAQLETATRELEGLKLARMRSEAAESAKLPAQLAERLNGSTLEELKADAERLAAVLPKPSPAVTNPGAANATQAATEAQLRARLYGQSANVFDPAAARLNGGGAFVLGKD